MDRRPVPSGTLNVLLMLLVQKKIATVDSSSDQCGAKCFNNPQCTHFTWQFLVFMGECYLYHNPTSMVEDSNLFALCGFINGRSQQSPNP